MSLKKSVMEMTPEEIERHYIGLFKQSESKQLANTSKDDGYAFKKVSVLKETSVDYSPNAQI